MHAALDVTWCNSQELPAISLSIAFEFEFEFELEYPSKGKESGPTTPNGPRRSTRGVSGREQDIDRKLVEELADSVCV
jgi:hypothetical protein